MGVTSFVIPPSGDLRRARVFGGWARARSGDGRGLGYDGGVGDTVDIYGGQDPRALPFYTPTEVARILRVSPATIKTWAFGRPYETSAGTRTWDPLIEPADARHKRLSFRNLVELNVLSALRGKDWRKPEEAIRRVGVDKIRNATARLRARLQTSHPLADVDVHTDWVDIYVEFLGELENVTHAQQSLRPVLERYLHRIDRDEHGLALRMFPPTRDGEEDGPRTIVIDPRRRFGRPVLVRTNIETSAIADRFFAGEDPADLARDFEVPESEIADALRFESLRRAA